MSALEDALRGSAGVEAMRPLHVFKVSWWGVCRGCLFLGTDRSCIGSNVPFPLHLQLLVQRGGPFSLLNVIAQKGIPYTYAEALSMLSVTY